MLKIIIYLIGCYFLLVFVLYVTQRNLIYFPSHYSPTPAEVGVPEMQVVSLDTEDGLKIQAWYRPPKGSDFPTIVYFHGNAGNIGHRGFIMKPFLSEGYGVLLLTYRGYSGNPGNPTEEGLYQDARAAMEFLNQENISAGRIYLYGNSIGGAVAIQMALEYSVAGIILQSPFTSLADVGQYHYPFLPVKWLVKDQFNSLSKVESIDVPIFIIHGEEDAIIPPKFGKKLYEAIPGSKDVVYVPNAGHNNLFKPDLIIQFITGTTAL